MRTRNTSARVRYCGIIPNHRSSRLVLEDEATPCFIHGSSYRYVGTHRFSRPDGAQDELIPRRWVKSYALPLYDPRVSCYRSSTVYGLNYIPHLTRGILSNLLLDETGIPEHAFSVARSLRTGKFIPPPIYVITGNQDGKVAHRQSLDVVAALKDIGAVVDYSELIADHSFDKEPIYNMESFYSFFHKVSQSRSSLISKL